MKEYGIKPKKQLGQNFLVDSSALHRIVEIASVSDEETILEIGPGLGSLTRLLATETNRVVAVELDKALLPPLRKTLEPFGNVDVLEGDILDYDPVRLIPDSEYIVVANIPYYVTSAIIRHLMETDRKPRRIVLTVQREVATRICSQPGEMSLLSLSVQVYGEPTIAARIAAGSFYPVPKVDSAVVRIDIYPEPRIPKENLDTFFNLARTAFGQKRKKLRNSLGAAPGLDPEKADQMMVSAGIDPGRRPETLNLDEWNHLVLSYLSDHPQGTKNHPPNNLNPAL